MFSSLYNLYFKRVTPITLKTILPSGPLKTNLIIINYNNNDKKPITNSNKSHYLELTGAQWDTGLHTYSWSRTAPPSSVEANTDVIHNQRQKTLKVASVLLFLHILSTKSWLECCFSLLNSRMWPGAVRDEAKIKKTFAYLHFR